MYAVRRRICFPTVPVEFPTAFQFFVFCVYFGLPVVAGKISSFLSLSVNISKTVADTAKVVVANGDCRILKFVVSVICFVIG